MPLVIEPSPPSPTRTLVEVHLDRHGLPEGGAAITRVDAPPSHVYALLRAIERYPGRVPMIHVAERRGNRVHVELRFRVSLLTTKFDFQTEIVEKPDELFEMRWVSGEPRNLLIRHELQALDGGKATMMRTFVGFDIMSLGWLVKYFLRHHPEIQFGVASGAALTLQHSLKQAITSGAGADLIAAAAAASR